MASCKACSKETARVFCNNRCQADWKYAQYIAEWKAGNITGLDVNGVVTRGVKRYLREKYGDKCCQCGWSEMNPATGKVPLIADHINGLWQDNCEENLRLVCPNCASLMPTHGALNIGRGRPQIAGLSGRGKTYDTARIQAIMKGT